MSPAYSFAGFWFHRDAGLLLDGRHVPLPRCEARVLEALLRAGGRIVTKDEIATLVWNGAPVSDGSIARALCGLRRTMRRHGAEDVIATLWGVGYRIAVPVEIVEAPASAHASLEGFVRAAHTLLTSGRTGDVDLATRVLERAVGLLTLARQPQ